MGGWNVAFVLLGEVVDESAVQGEHACVVGDGCTGVGAERFELDDGRWIDHSTVTLAESTGSSGDGLLSNGKLKVYWWWSTDAGFCLDIF
jgi:hypothetical protein